MQNTRFYFFSGKGGVGKTTMAAASAVYFAHHRQKTLIITTDPASNLADVFEQTIGHKITPVQGVDNLFAMELDPVYCDVVVRRWEIATGKAAERQVA